MSRQFKVECVALILYVFIVLKSDRSTGLRTAALCIRWYGNRCRDLGNWAYTQAIYSDNAYRELIEP